MFEITIKDLDKSDDDNEVKFITSGFIMSCLHEKGLDKGISLVQQGKDDTDIVAFALNFYARYTDVLKEIFESTPVLHDIFNRTSIALNNVKDSSLQPSSFERLN